GLAGLLAVRLSSRLPAVRWLPARTAGLGWIRHGSSPLSPELTRFSQCAGCLLCHAGHGVRCGMPRSLCESEAVHPFCPIDVGVRPAVQLPYSSSTDLTHQPLPEPSSRTSSESGASVPSVVLPAIGTG